MANSAVTEQNLSDIRAALLKTTERKRTPIKYNGVDLELVQPTVGDIQDMRTGDEAKSSKNDGFIRVMVKFAVIPGTDIHPLTEEDIDVMRSQPWSAEVVKIVESFGKLSDINIEDEAKNSEETAS